ncbi:MAG: tetratricopeptide repeat protein, partial [Planctomycetota bacterium]
PVSVREYGIWELSKKWILRNKQKITLILFVISVAFIVKLQAQWKKEQDEQKKYQEAIRESNTAQKKAELLVGASELEQRERVKNYLSALYFIDKALEIYRTETLEQYKLQIGNALKQLCFESKDYQLAHYIAQKMGELSILSPEKKSRWKAEVQEAQESLLKENQHSLKNWIQKFKEGKLQEGERIDALFAISKMQEKPILVKLLQELKEGTIYYLKGEKHNTDLNAFYPFVAEVVGRIGNKEASADIWLELETLCDHLRNLSTGKQTEEEQYAIALAQAIGNLGEFTFGPQLDEIRWKMDESRLFWSKTQHASQKLNLEMIQSLEESIQKNPFNSEAYRSRGFVKCQLREWNSAIEDFNKVIQLDPNYYRTYNSRGIAKTNLKEWDSAIEDFSRAIQLNPRFSEAFMNRGVANSDKGDLDSALKDFNYIISNNPNPGNAYFNRGIINCKKKEWDSAIEDFSRAISFNPNNLNAYLRRGSAKIDKGDFDSALEDFNKIILLDLNYAEAYYKRGSVNYKKGELNKALEDFNKTIQLNPNHIQSYHERGILKNDKGEWDSAIEDFNKVIFLNPASSEVYYNRGIVKSKKRDWTSALEDFDQAIFLDPNHATAYNERGIAYANIGKSELAISDFNNTIRLNPQVAQSYNNRGIEKMKLQEWESALEDFNQAISLDPNYANAYNGRGSVKLEIGKLEEALEDFNRCIQMNPNSAKAYYNIGKIYQQLKENKKALLFWEEGLQIRYDSQVHEDFLNLLFEEAILKYRRKEYESA